MLMTFLFIAVGATIGISAGVTYNTKHIREEEFVKREELAKVLEHRGIEIGEETECAICHKKLDLNNIGKIIPIGEEIKFICDDDECMIMQNSIRFNN